MIGSAIRRWGDVADGDALVAVLCGDLDAADRPLPPAVAHSVVVATRAFVVADGRFEDAVRQVGPTLMGIGRRAAVRGHSAERLSRDLRQVVDERTRRADQVIARVCPREERDALRGGLERFLDQLHRAALAGHRQARTMMALAPDARRDMVARAVFASAAVPEELLVLAGIDPAAAYLPVVWVSGTAPRPPDPPPDVLVDPTGRALLVPDGSVPGLEPEDRVVTGPARPAADVAESLQLARQAAAAIRAGVIRTERPVTSCADVAAELLVAGRPALADLLVDKYLAQLRALRPARRVEIGEVLLTWLETRASLAEVAAAHHIAKQTAHDRLRQGRRLLGPAIDEPASHAAVVLALHAALDGWRAEVARG
ncbi:helix-turn-helix domain-containing protein [Pimelobacter simplex]|uniref:helix-turn-helix domain-containing protein n=1 Tax=Nocardioides simplex TaxID=2045 RepID=UPI0019347940|nr:helix-turn-helix domain-containing protein [Pimelobacter simplex]